MKHFFMFFLLVFSTHLLSAQSWDKKVNARHKQVLAHLLRQNRSFHNSTARVTSTTEHRVIAQRTDSVTVLVDSVNLSYPSGVGSTYDFNDMIYPYNYPYSNSPMFNYAGTFTTPQVLFDTFMHWEENPYTFAYGLYESAYAGYDVNNNLINYLDIFTDSTITNNKSYINTFTSVNSINSGYWFNFSAGVDDSAFSQFFSYNSSGLLTEDSLYEYHLGAWYIVSKAYYTYNTSNDLIQIDYYANDTDTSFTLPLIEIEQYVNTYDASNRLLTVLNNTFNGTALDSNVEDTFAYTGTNTYHNYWHEYQYDPINNYWAPWYNMQKIIGGIGLPDTVNVYSFDSVANAWEPFTMDLVSYNSSGLPDTLFEYDYNFVSFPATPNYTTVYYYQTYTNTEATNNVVKLNDAISIYPNPVLDIVTISQSGILQKGMLTVTLTNISGQVVSKQEIPSQEQMQISIGHLVPGTYLVMIQDASGNLLHRQPLVKP